jgi:hypothetical protein
MDRSVQVNKQRNTFRYEIMWERNAELQTAIERSWLRKNPGSDLEALCKSLETVANDLK